MMRRWVVGLLSVFLLAIAAGPALGQEPSEPPWWEAPPTWLGGRVEVSGLGVAMSFPDDWRVWSLEGRTDLVWPVVSWAEVLGPGVERHEVLYASEPQGDTGDYRGDSCLLRLYRPTDVTAQEFVADMDEKSSLVVPDVAVDAIHEQVARLRYDIGFLPVIEFYAIADGETLAVLQCIGFERNYDRWLAIAETFEFLPAEE